jgi:uncharacterized protein
MTQQTDNEPLEMTDINQDEPYHRWSESPTFQEVVARRYSRRDMMRGSLAMAVAGLFGSAVTEANPLARQGGVPPGLQRAGKRPSLLGFEAVPPGFLDEIVVPEGYSYQVILPWGTPITGHYPAFSPDNTGAEQGMQIGMHHDGMHFFPFDSRAYHSPRGLALQGRAGDHPLNARSSSEGLLVMNHEYVETRFLIGEMHGTVAGAFTTSSLPDGTRDPDHVLKEMNAHGVSITRIRKGPNGQWDMVPDALNRRITVLTPMEIGGPLRGHDSVKTKYSPEGLMTRGTFNNCAHGVTPWGTYLACEENFWFYFRHQNPSSRPPSLSRYSIGVFTFWPWFNAANGADEYVRFDITPTGESATDDYRNEAHCVGWVVEIDPFDPHSTPVKRTHLGRFSHEGAVFGPALEGKPTVVYSGDDATNSYIFKFVSARNYHRATADGSLLDEGTLYVARFNEDGSGDWLALVPGENGLTAENGFPDLQSVLLNARGAGDIVGATPMDRPEWGAVDPITGDVYFTLTNNSGRQVVDAANPRTGNIYGHIIRWREANGDHMSTGFQWEIFALGGNEEQGRDLNGNPLTPDNVFGSPDGLWVDPDGRLWIQTDASDNAVNTPAYVGIGANQMLAADPATGEIRRFLTGPIAQEITGCIMTPDQRTLFVNVQHPGANTGSSAFAAGDYSSNWPDGGNSIPRSATVVITKNDGGKIGT